MDTPLPGEAQPDPKPETESPKPKHVVIGSETSVTIVRSLGDLHALDGKAVAPGVYRLVEVRRLEWIRAGEADSSGFLS